MARDRVVTTTTTRYHYDLRNPARSWLMVLGWLLLAVAILGLIPPMVDLLHGLRMHIEGGEMVLHWVLAATTLLVAYAVRKARVSATIAILFGITYLATGLFGFIVGRVGAWHVALGDNLLHLALGAITLVTGMTTLRGDVGRTRTRRASTA